MTVVLILSGFALATMLYGAGYHSGRDNQNEIEMEYRKSLYNIEALKIEINKLKKGGDGEKIKNTDK